MGNHDTVDRKELYQEIEAVVKIIKDISDLEHSSDPVVRLGRTRTRLYIRLGEEMQKLSNKEKKKNFKTRWLYF